MNRKSRGRGVFVAVLAGLAAGGSLLWSVTGPVSADVNEVSGSAFALSANVLGIVNIPPTPAGVSGSAAEPSDGYDTGLVSAVPVDVPGLLHVGVLEAQSQGGGVAADNHFGFAESDARAADVVVGSILLPALQALVIRSECRSDGDGSTGLTELIGATAGGSPLVQTPAANTNITIGDPAAPIATAILNEQTEVNIPGVATSIVVTAVHINVLPNPITGLGAIEAIIGRSACAAQGPDVLLTTTTTSGVTTTTSGVTTTTSGVTTTTSGNTTTTGGNTTTTGGNITTTTGGNITTTTGGNITTTTGGPIVTTVTTGGGGGGGGNITTPRGGVTPVSTLARTGSTIQRVITLAFLALVLGGLFVLGGKGLASDPVPAKARARRRNNKGVL